MFDSRFFDEAWPTISRSLESEADAGLPLQLVRQVALNLFSSIGFFTVATK